jgi:hypothetical protein
MHDHGRGVLRARFKRGIVGLSLGQVAPGRVDVVYVAEPIEASFKDGLSRHGAVVMEQDGGSTDNAEVAVAVDVTSEAGAVLFQASTSMGCMNDDAVVCGHVAGIESLGGADVALAGSLVVGVVLDERSIGMQELVIWLQVKVEVLLEGAEAEAKRVLIRGRCSGL